MPDTSIRHLGTVYHEWVRTHPNAAEDFVDAIDDLLSDAGVTFDRVSARVKTWASLKAKAKKLDGDGNPAYPDPLRDINDVMGVRVTVFHSTEIPVALGVLRESFIVLKSVDKAAETRIAGGFGYGSHHLVLQVPTGGAGIDEELSAYAGLRFEVQVRTVLQHAWAEFEHDIRYKGGAAPLDPQVDRSFTLAAGLIELADQQFDQIVALTEPKDDREEDIGEVEITPETLPGILAMLLGTRFPSSRSEYYRWLDEILKANGIETVAELAQLLNEEDINYVIEAMDYHFTPGQVRLIDDLLLHRFGEEHIERTQQSGIRAASRARRLHPRLKKLRSAH